MKKVILICMMLGTSSAFSQSVATVLFTSKKVVANRNGIERVLSRGASLEAGDAIVTSKEAVANIKYENGTLVNIGENSNYKILAYSPTSSNDKIQAELVVGKIKFKTTGKLQESLKTPVMALAILGTSGSIYVKFKPKGSVSCTPTSSLTTSASAQVTSGANATSSNATSSASSAVISASSVTNPGSGTTTSAVSKSTPACTASDFKLFVAVESGAVKAENTMITPGESVGITSNGVVTQEPLPAEGIVQVPVNSEGAIPSGQSTEQQVTVPEQTSVDSTVSPTTADTESVQEQTSPEASSSAESTGAGTEQEQASTESEQITESIGTETEQEQVSTDSGQSSESTFTESVSLLETSQVVGEATVDSTQATQSASVVSTLPEISVICP